MLHVRFLAPKCSVVWITSVCLSVFFTKVECNQKYPPWRGWATSGSAPGKNHVDLGLVHIVRFFSDCDCNSSYRNKWVVQDSMEVFTLWGFNNITNSHLARNKQKQIAIAIRKKRTVWMNLLHQGMTVTGI